MRAVQKGSVYLKHIATRSIRNARQANTLILFSFVICLIILMRALAGAGYDPLAEQEASQSMSRLQYWKNLSQERIGNMGWEYLGKPGMGFWEQIKHREEDWQNKWISPAIDAVKHQALAFGGVHEHIDAEFVDHHLTEDDHELFAPAHTYAYLDEDA